MSADIPWQVLHKLREEMRPQITGRMYRVMETLRMRLPPEKRPPSRLTPEQHQFAFGRWRNLRPVKWADKAAIRALYAEAKRLTKETGIHHQVDHIIPLKGEFVSGLHVETNLRVITRTENIRKRNTVCM